MANDKNKKNNRDEDVIKRDELFGSVRLSRKPKVKKPNADGRAHHKADAVKVLLNSTSSDNKQVTPHDEDVLAVNDYMRSISLAYENLAATLNASSVVDTPGSGAVSIESQITPALSKFAQETQAAMLAYFTKVATSTSSFYPDNIKRDASAFIDAHRASANAADGTEGRSLRLQFASISRFMLNRPFPSIAGEVVHSFEELMRFVESHKLEHVFTPWSSATDNPNGKIDDGGDPRGESDINLFYYLPFLPVTPYFKELLVAKGVSSSLISCLGNYSVSCWGDGLTSDEDAEFSASTFKDVTTSLWGANPSAFRRYGGPSFCNEIQQDLLNFIDKVSLRSKVVMSTITEHGVDGDTGEDVILGYENAFNPDLAVKLWMRTALNAVYKVLVEDGLGFMDRVGTSIGRNVKLGVPAFVPDVVAQLLNTNRWFTKKMFDDASLFLKGRSVEYNRTVYEFIKKRWAPITTTYQSSVKRFIDKDSIPSVEYEVRLLPKLLLPVNPFDAAVREYETKHANSSSLLSEDPEDRSPMYTRTTLPKAYVDPRTGVTLSAITIHFDNFLSYALFVTKRNDRYNAHSYKASSTDPAFDRATCSDLTKTSWSGPWVVKEPTTGTGTHDDSVFTPDLVCSFHDRRVALGQSHSGLTTYVHPYQCRIVAKDGASIINGATPGTEVTAADDAKNDIGGIAMVVASYHTNELCVRMASTCDWFNRNPFFIARLSQQQVRMTRFVTGVVAGDVSYVGVPSVSANRPCFAAKSSDVGGLSPQHFFRYSFVNDPDADSPRMVAFDNFSAIKPGVVWGLSHDSRLASRFKTTYYVNAHASGKSVNKAAIEATDIDPNGAFLPFLGLSLAQCDRLGGSVVVTELSILNPDGVVKRDIKTLLSSGDLWSPKHLVVSELPPMFIPKIGSSDGYVQFGGVNRPNTFTKRVDLLAPSTFKGTGEPDVANPRLVSDTLIQDLSVARICMNRWSRAVKAWNSDNPIQEDYGREGLDTNNLIDYVLSPFSSRSLVAAELYIPNLEGVDANSYHVGDKTNPTPDTVRYSCSACVALLSGSGTPTASARTVLPAMMLDTMQYRNLTSIAHVTGTWTWASPKATKTVMKALRQQVIDQLNNKAYCYCDSRLHGEPIRVASDISQVRERKTWYKAQLPEITTNSHNYTADSRDMSDEILR